MYLYKQPQKNGDIYLSIKEKYHVPRDHYAPFLAKIASTCSLFS